MVCILIVHLCGNECDFLPKWGHKGHRVINAIFYCLLCIRRNDHALCTRAPKLTDGTKAEKSDQIDPSVISAPAPYFDAGANDEYNIAWTLRMRSEISFISFLIVSITQEHQQIKNQINAVIPWLTKNSGFGHYCCTVCTNWKLDIF